jgi:hypothetical protein
LSSNIRDHKNMRKPFKVIQEKLKAASLRKGLRCFKNHTKD